MKRTELKRRTPLKATKPLQAKTGLQSRSILTRKGLRRLSKKQQNINTQYAFRRDVFLGLHERCEVEDCRNESTQIHHRRGRNGANMLDESTWLSCCADCHRKLHDNPAWAYERGYMLSRHTKKEAE